LVQPVALVPPLVVKYIPAFVLVQVALEHPPADVPPAVDR